MDYAFQYIKSNKGIDTEASYPYTAKTGPTCLFNAANVGATDTGYTDITSGSEEAPTEAIASVGPISVAIDASHPSFQLYKSGVYNEPQCSSTNLDHGVLAVGYDSANGTDYYIVKNSWGTGWGMQGYIFMSATRTTSAALPRCRPTRSCKQLLPETGSLFPSSPARARQLAGTRVRQRPACDVRERE